MPVLFAFDILEAVCGERNRARPDRQFGGHVVRNHVELLRRSLRGLQREGFRIVHTLASSEAMDAAEIVREPLFTDRRGDAGPFDTIGDVHGCLVELTELLEGLGYAQGSNARRHPRGRRAIFVGDLVDRGPDSPGVLRLVMDMIAAGTALCVQGNHDKKLLRKLPGRDVQMTHGLPETLAQLDAFGDTRAAFVEETRIFLDGLRSPYWLDGGKLVVAHAGLPETMHGRGSGAVRSFALYGETTGETDEFGLPVRYEWARDYRGEASVIYDHTPIPSPEWVNRTLCIDTGCVYVGSLTALRYPEREIVSVRARAEYAAPLRKPSAQPAAADPHDLLDVGDVSGKCIVTTRLMPSITIREENAAAALEVMGRFCVDPRWLIHLPPTMSPSETSAREGLLEQPDEAFAHYRHAGVARVVVVEKHMGSRAIVIICRNAEATRARFGIGSTRGRSTRAQAAHSSPMRQPSRPFGPTVGRDDRDRLLGSCRYRLSLHRRRADALVGEGPGADRGAVRARRHRRDRRPRRCRRTAGGRTGTRRGRRRVAGPLRAPARRRSPLRCGLAPLRLAGAHAGRPQAGPVHLLALGEDRPANPAHSAADQERSDSRGHGPPALR
jgi:protein phosphatase